MAKLIKFKTAELGQAAELLACNYLEKQGLKLITRNFRCRMGEIDLIMQDKVELVFIEVRYRQSNDFGGAIDSIDKHKCHKMVKTASYYLQQNAVADESPCRFDVMIVYSVERERLEWIQDAFRLDD
jgi:putative endonuclease